QGTPAGLMACPDSHYRAMLEAEALVREGLWSSAVWRRLWLADGRLDEAKRHEGTFMIDLDTLTWAVAQLGEAVAALGRCSGLVPRVRETPASPEGLAREGAEALEAWIEATAAWLGLEAEAVETPYTEVEQLVRAAGPALLRLPGTG